MSQFSAVELYFLEKKAARNSVLKLRRGVLSAIRETTNDKSTVKGKGDKTYSYSNSGVALKLSGAKSVFKDNRLSRISIVAPHYIFKQHYGFEGNKKNGVAMRLAATSVISKALEKANTLETLIEDISAIRADEVTAKLNFK